MNELFVNKTHFFKFLSMSGKPRLHQLKIITSSRSSTVKAFLTEWMFSSVRGNAIKEHAMLRTNTKPHQLTKHAKISYSIASLVFRKFLYRTYRNGLNRVPQSLGTTSTSKSMSRVSSIVRVSLLGIRILVYSCTGCGTSKIYLCLEDNRSSFSRVSLKSEIKDARP